MTRQNTLLKLKEQERQLRRQLIVDAAREVFGDKTYDSVSMAEIARTAGIAKSSIYTYFKSQEDLYIEIIVQDSGEFIEGLKKRVAKSEDSPAGTMIKYFLEYYTRHEARWRMINHLAIHGKAVATPPMRTNAIGRELLSIFDEAFSVIENPTRARMLSHTLFSALSGILIAYRKFPGRSEKERMEHINRLGSVLEDMIHALVEKESAR